MEVVCRVCFKGYNKEVCLALSCSSGFPAVKTINKLLENVIPEMNSTLIDDSYLCFTCWDIITRFYRLKMECLENEQNFFEFLADNSWQGSIEDFVFSSETPKEEPVGDDGVEHTEIETTEEQPITLVVIDDSETVTENNPEFVSPDVEYTVQDDIEEGEVQDLNPLDQNTVELTIESLEEPKLLTCSSCRIQCQNFKEALSHTTESHGVQSIMCCKFCSDFFMDVDALKKHAKIHLIEYTCQFCEETFVTKISLAKHHKTHPEFVALKEQENFTCPYCIMSFDSFGAFKKHRRSHFRASYTCEICGKSHASKQLLREHRFIHGNVKRYMCEKCGQCFKQQSRLHWHNYRYHLNVKTKQCPQCPKKFFKSYDLKIHQVVHTREKKYECAVCLKRFTLRGNLTRHLNTHTGQRFYCNVCGRSYTQRNDLKKHACRSKSYHKEVEQSAEGGSVDCKICGKTYKKSYIKFHLRKHTGEKPEQCKVCGRGFSSITNLGRHMMIHTGEKRFKCDECDRSFIQKVDYEAHMRRKHTGERPYECKICEKSFFEFSVLHRHKKTRTHQLALQHANE